MINFDQKKCLNGRLKTGKLNKENLEKKENLIYFKK